MVGGVVTAAGESIEADLVIDASGRGSRAPEWQKPFGCEVPETRLDANWGYASRLYRATRDIGCSGLGGHPLAGGEDNDICLKMLETFHMLRSPDWMFAPEIRERVERDWVRLGRKVGAKDLQAAAG